MIVDRFGQKFKVVEINYICPERGFDFLLEDEEGNQIREWGKNLTKEPNDECFNSR